jgi:hypothetical protein
MSTKLHDVQPCGGGTIIHNPSPDLMFLITAKQAVKLEAMGMRITRGPKVTPRILKRFGLKRTTPTVDVLARVDQEIALVREQIAALNAAPNDNVQA